MAHVKRVSIGIKIDGDLRHFNVPSVQSGKPLSDAQMFDLAFEASKTSKGFATPQQADAANKAQSAAGQRRRAKQMQTQVSAAKRSKK